MHRSRSFKLILAYKLSDRVFTAHYLGAPLGGKTVILSHGVEIPEKTSSRDKPIILYVGRVSRSKRLEVVIKGFSKAYNLLQEKGDNPIKLRIVGPIDYEYLKELESINYDFRNVEFVGPVSHNKIWEEYLSASVFVSASKTGLDKTTLEAMASGLPVLVNDKIYRETLEELSYFCIFDNPDELADKIYKLMTDKDLRNKIGEKCRDKVIQKHSVTIFISKLINELNKKFISEI